MEKILKHWKGDKVNYINYKILFSNILTLILIKILEKFVLDKEKIFTYLWMSFQLVYNSKILEQPKYSVMIVIEIRLPSIL